MEITSFCPSCGTTVIAGKALCDHCGASLTTNQTGKSIAQPVMELPPEFSGLKRPKTGSHPLAMLMPLFFGIPWTIFSLVFLFMIIGSTLREQAQFNRLKDEGVTVPGIVTRREMDESDDSRGYFIYYRFVAPVNGRPQTFEHYGSVSQSVYNSFKTGGNLDVLYAASDPQLSVVKASFGPPGFLTLVLIGGMSLLFTGIGVVLIILGFQAAKDFLQLRLQGQSAQAIIFDRWDAFDSDGSSYYVAYAFRAASRQSGQKIISNAQQSIQAYKKLNIGEKVRIRYLPDRPEICQMTDFDW